MLNKARCLSLLTNSMQNQEHGKSCTRVLQGRNGIRNKTPNSRKTSSNKSVWTNLKRKRILRETWRKKIRLWRWLVIIWLGRRLMGGRNIHLHPKISSKITKKCLRKICTLQTNISQLYNKTPNSQLKIQGKRIKLWMLWLRQRTYLHNHSRFSNTKEFRKWLRRRLRLRPTLPQNLQNPFSNSPTPSNANNTVRISLRSP